MKIFKIIFFPFVIFWWFLKIFLWLLKPNKKEMRRQQRNAKRRSDTLIRKGRTESAAAERRKYGMK